MSTRSEDDFFSIFLLLKGILKKYTSTKLLLRETQTDFCELIGPSTPVSRGREVWFGAARIGKRYVSYHLMPVYVFPDLLDGISPELKKRMQGKSCFNYTHVDERLFHELSELTKQGYERYEKEGFIG